MPPATSPGRGPRAPPRPASPRSAGLRWMPLAPARSLAHEMGLTLPAGFAEERHCEDDPEVYRREVWLIGEVL